tara:strand:+ start:1604 stop:2617 length:1014 start_codon:yes stop_codon:yes gene_type:complete
MNLYSVKIIIRKFRKILFFNSHNNIYNFLLISLISIFSLKTLKWFIFNARWKVVTSNLSLFAYGIFPENQQWRPLAWIISILIISVFTLSSYKWEFLKKILIIMWIGTIPLGIFLLYGGIGLTPVLSRNIGGLTLSIFLTLCSLLFSLPLGIALAFCRQSSLFIIKKLSSIYIDTMRSIPLIAVLFFGQLLIPLFLPLGIEIDRVWRAIFAFSFFVSAYIAEDIRGGLQSIPLSQIEAAKSLGLNQLQIIRFILIPQSLRLALPALTNQTIGLFQNTSLMSILGLVELLGIGRSILANPEFIGQYIEVYVWLACVYWLICTIMAIIARNLEKSLTIR